VAGLDDRISFAADASKIAQNSHEAQELSAHFPAPGGPPPAARANGADAAAAYFSTAEFSSRNGHRRVEEARAVRLEDELVLRGIKLRGRGSERCGPCPQCGGDDRFSINVKDQVFNCRGCGAKGHGAIDLVMFLDGLDFKGAVEMLTGQAPATATKMVAAPAKEPEQLREVPGTSWVYDSADRTVQILRVQRIEFQTLAGEWVMKNGKRHKIFWQFHREGNNWVKGGVKDKELVLFRLSELLDDLNAGMEIYFVEGEKCVDAVREIGLPATCHAMGVALAGALCRNAPWRDYHDHSRS
jgi:CHC2 zinc finger